VNRRVGELVEQGVDDIEAVAGRIRAVGAQSWLAVSPETQIEQYRIDLSYVDGLLVMLTDPGTKQSANVAHLDKVASAHEQYSTGVDGGVTEEILDQILRGGTGYVVVGRSLFACPKKRRK
jgi:pentose-5-phosphate-3-epimerase